MNPKIVGGYIRVSTQEQSQKGLSLETQTYEIEEYCRQRGYKLAKIYVDRGITARKNLYKRSSFMEMMNDVKAHKIDHIVVLRLDRFFRNVYDYHRMMNEYLTPNGCGWSAIKEDYDTTTTNGRLMINLRLSIAEQESDQDSDRIKDVFANRIRAGYVVGGSLPFGLSISDDKRPIPNEYAPIVKDIFDTMIATNSARETMIQIGDKYGMRFDYNRITRILKTERYTGRYKGVESYCEPIISKEIFDKVQLELSRNARTKKRKENYIFSGIVICKECGHRLAGSSNIKGPGFKYYRCNNAITNHKCSNHKHVKETVIEQYLLKNVDDLLKDYAITFEAKDKDQVAKKSNKDKIEKKINRLNELFINGMIDMDELKARRADLESQIIDDDDSKKIDLVKVNQFLNSGFKNIYEDLTLDERRTLWRSVIKEIHIDGYEVSSVIFL